MSRTDYVPSSDEIAAQREKQAHIATLQARAGGAPMSELDPKPITLDLALPASPIVILDEEWMRALSALEGEVLALKVVDAGSSTKGFALQKRLTAAATALDKERLAATKPFRDLVDRINERCTVVDIRVKEYKNVLNRRLVDYDTKQRQIAAEAERKRLADLAALEAEQKRQQAIEDEKLKAIAASAKPVELFDLPDWDDEPKAPLPKTQIEKQIEALKHPTAVAATVAPSGGHFRTTVRIKSTDVDKVPDHFVTRTANEKLIRETFCTGWRAPQPLPECPGVVFEMERIPIGKSNGVENF